MTQPRRHRIGGDDALDARSRIQIVALEMFIEEGYDKTSLREIAEKLGVSKAALYYHFPTKDDILNSLIEDRIATIAQLIAWAQEQPRTEATRQEFIRRYAAELQGPLSLKIMQFFERNQTVVKNLSADERMRDQMRDVMHVLVDPESAPAEQLRRSLSIFAVHASWFVFREQNWTEDQRREAALEVALGLVT
jgi:AcrR family transcriptional regulator